MNMLLDMLGKVGFAGGLIAGLQLPAFVTFYHQRLAGHLQEAARQVMHYQSIADRYHDGDLQALIALHLASSEASFFAEASVIQSAIDRTAYLSDRVTALGGEWWRRIIDLATHLDLGIARDTVSQMPLSIPLTEEALVYGLAVALLLGYFPALTVKAMRALTHRVG